MSKNIEKKLKEYTVVSSPNKQKELIILGEEKMRKQQLHRHSQIHLLKTTLRFIRIKIWIIQGFIFLLTISLTSVHHTTQFSFNITMTSYLLLLLLSMLFFLEEIYITGMNLLEQTLKYNLNQQIFMKLFIFCFIDLLGVIFLAYQGSQTLVIPFITMFLYLAVPFNLGCLLLFITLPIWSKYTNQILYWLIGGLLASGVFVLINVFDIYQIELIYWQLSLILTSLLLIGIIFLRLKQSMKSGDMVWN
jgi:hypothetical protein